MTRAAVVKDTGRGEDIGRGEDTGRAGDTGCGKDTGRYRGEDTDGYRIELATQKV